ncbi:MAG TPA: SIR2 family protein [Vicinamibacteria bacterium]|nr:SIR2 family protein [Vicinamibacteria bacterium]
MIEYLKSGKAWVLVGSGPSIEAGYPSWEELATATLETVRSEHRTADVAAIKAALAKKNYPGVFEQARGFIGEPRLLQSLHASLRPVRAGHIYDVIARWPVDVYLTTNFEDEIQNSLAKLKLAYTPYGNCPEHMGRLTPDLRGAIFKLHGDLRSENGLVLTAAQYQDILSGPGWEHWRTRMKAVFQMGKLVVVGHSLVDPHIRHLLEAAKQGASVEQPICWLAPDVSPDEAREYLERHRIRVISYPNQSGDHGALLRLLRQVSQFVPPRTSVTIRNQIAKVSTSPLGRNAGAPGFFVFNKLAAQEDYDQKRADIALSVLEAAVAALRGREPFRLEDALILAGWPKESLPGTSFLDGVGTLGVGRGLLEQCTGGFRVGAQASSLSAENQARFEQMRDRFKQSIALRIRRAYPVLLGDDCQQIAGDIEASLTGYFRHGGLTLATTLFASGKASQEIVLPSSIVGFISEAATRYDDLLRRQAFFDASLEAFTHAEVAEREYLGRISQGFFAFHALGVFGDVAAERIREAQRTVWLVDSHVQIPALALGAPLSHLFRTTLDRFKGCGIRLFTTRSLFEETREHFWFADNVVRKYGARSIDVLQGASGETPYRKSNQFLQGFVQWLAAGKAGEWESYVFEALGHRRVSANELEQALVALGVEVIDFQAWPGFDQTHFLARDECVEKISKLREPALGAAPSSDDWEEVHRKALPEAEAFLVIKHERDGSYRALEEGQQTKAWFVSETSILNKLEPGLRITWQAEAFLRFASTLAPGQPVASADAAFETLVWAIARSGVNMVDEKSVETVFGGLIDAASLTLEEQRELYHETLEAKYGAPASAVLERVPTKARPLAAVQLLRELLAKQEESSKTARAALEEERKRAAKAERTLRELEALRKKLEARKQRSARKKRQQAGSKRKAKGHKS